MYDNSKYKMKSIKCNIVFIQLKQRKLIFNNKKLWMNYVMKHISLQKTYVIRTNDVFKEFF